MPLRDVWPEWRFAPRAWRPEAHGFARSRSLVSRTMGFLARWLFCSRPRALNLRIRRPQCHTPVAFCLVRARAHSEAPRRLVTVLWSPLVVSRSDLYSNRIAPEGSRGPFTQPHTPCDAGPHRARGRPAGAVAGGQRALAAWLLRGLFCEVTLGEGRAWESEVSPSHWSRGSAAPLWLSV